MHIAASPNQRAQGVCFCKIPRGSGEANLHSKAAIERRSSHRQTTTDRVKEGCKKSRK